MTKEKEREWGTKIVRNFVLQNSLNFNSLWKFWQQASLQWREQTLAMQKLWWFICIGQTSWRITFKCGVICLKANGKTSYIFYKWPWKHPFAYFETRFDNSINPTDCISFILLFTLALLWFNNPHKFFFNKSCNL